MYIEKISDMLVKNYKCKNRRNRTMFLLGPSGVGKSDAVRQAAVDLGNLPVLDLRLSQMEPPDFSGVPSVREGATVKNPPAWLPRNPESNGIIFLDEITSAPPVMQAVAYQLALDRRMGDTALPEGWMVVAAGNRVSDRGVTYSLAAPLLARMTLINVQSSLDGFIRYCAKKAVRPEIMAFVKSRGEYLNERDETINTKSGEIPLGKPFANQRAWTTAAQYYLDELPEDRLELLRGSVGDRAANDLEAFLRIWQTMPSIDMVFSDPDAVETPKDAATRYAISMGVSARLTNQNFSVAKKYIDRLPGEFKVMTIRLATMRDNSVMECSAFAEFVQQNPEVWKRGG